MLNKYYCFNQTFSQYLIKCFSIVMRHGIYNFESSVVVQELALAMKRALYGLL